MFTQEGVQIKPGLRGFNVGFPGEEFTHVGNAFEAVNLAKNLVRERNRQHQLNKCLICHGDHETSIHAKVEGLHSVEDLSIVKNIQEARAKLELL